MVKNPILRCAAADLGRKFQQLDIKSINVSDDGKNYLRKYSENFTFYMSMYCQLLEKAIKKLKKPIGESTFIDYGGGIGLLSLLAKETGFGTVIYNDLNKTRAIEAEIISENFGCNIDHYVYGDIDEVIIYLNHNKIKPDLICSFDVLEHIYDLESWISSLAKINGEFVIVFMTSANPRNPLIARKLRNMQIKSEHYGGNNNIRIGNSFSDNSFLEERRNIIKNRYPGLNRNDLNLLTTRSRGLKDSDIEAFVKAFIETGKLIYKIKHPTNTCDPYTGSWVENLIDLKNLKVILEKRNLHTEFHNTYYAYSYNKLLNITKYILNQFIRLIGPNSLFLSPAFTLEIEKTNH